MSTPPDRRSRRRLATRQAISDAATRLFHKRGFDQVTVDVIAEAADVGRMTVFNHFPRKEDMFFDLDDYLRAELIAALQQREPGVPPIETLRQFAHRACEEQKPYVRFFRGSQRFMQTIESSEALKARARAIRDEVAQLLAMALSKTVGRSPDDLDAQLVAALLVTTWGVAFVQAHGCFRRSQNAGKAKSVFLGLIDQGSIGINAAMAGTPYA